MILIKSLSRDDNLLFHCPGLGIALFSNVSMIRVSVMAISVTHVSRGYFSMSNVSMIRVSVTHVSQGYFVFAMLEWYVSMTHVSRGDFTI